MARITGTDVDREILTGTDANDFFDTNDTMEASVNRIYTQGGEDIILVTPEDIGVIIGVQDFDPSRDALVINGFESLRTFDDLRPSIYHIAGDEESTSIGYDTPEGAHRFFFHLESVPNQYLNEENVLFNFTVPDNYGKTVTRLDLARIPVDKPDLPFHPPLRDLDLAGVSEPGDFGSF